MAARLNSTTSKRTMVLGFRKSSPQPWTLGSYPGYPGPTMLVTNVPTYSVASPCYSYAPQLASPMIAQVPVSPFVQTIPVPVPVPVPVAVQSPVMQMPPPTTTYTVFQPVSSIPSPVIQAPVTMAPANPFPVRAPPSPRPQHPQPTVDAGNALMLVQTPQQAPQSSPSVINISLHLPTPQQHPMQLNAVAQYQNHLPERVQWQPQVIDTRPTTPSPADPTTCNYQTPAGDRISIQIERSPRPGMPSPLPALSLAQW